MQSKKSANAVDANDTHGLLFDTSTTLNSKHRKKKHMEQFEYNINLILLRVKTEREYNSAVSVVPTLKKKYTEWNIHSAKGSRTSIIIRRDNTLLYSNGGKVSEGTWELLKLNGETMVVRVNGNIYKYVKLFYSTETSIAIFQKSDTEEYIVLCQGTTDWYETLKRHFDFVESRRRQHEREYQQLIEEERIFNQYYKDSKQKIPFFSTLRFVHFLVFFNLVISTLVLLIVGPLARLDYEFGWGIFAKYSLFANEHAQLMFFACMYVGIMIWSGTLVSVNEHIEKRRELFREKQFIKRIQKNDRFAICMQCKYYIGKREEYIDKHINDDSNVSMLFFQFIYNAICLGSLFIFRYVQDSSWWVIVLTFIGIIGALFGIANGIDSLYKKIVGD